MLEYCIKQARKLSTETHRQRLWAVVVDKRGNILGEGCNSFTKTSTYQARMATKAGKDECQYLHAEIASLTRVVRNKSRAKPYAIFVARVDKAGNSKLAKPCAICELAIQSSDIQHVIYSI